ncbi:Uncharacterized protein MSYG_1597 [Malassezia sympodialis ATCC 42132]|uniref:FAM192A/Fyv6 N-terminal domain-containing protein n=1 Tax=Malassezia sympodialis (strain ATCC 42132) TaxID=1230383 RepID=A0A1M8A490_MALS4|nr:Uncharacterized protein MSYG_1597 [Malassezia sympodialis ATCC 42132]
MSSAAGSTAPQFVSQRELSDSQKRREKEIREAYARIGEEPPPAPVDEAYDPRPLYERLQEAKAIQDEKLEEMFKLRNQFRGLDESESQFLADIHRARQKREETKRSEEAKELERFRRATETKGTVTTAPAADKTTIPTIPKRTDASGKRKRGKENALGIVRKTTAPPYDRPLATTATAGTQASEAPRLTESSMKPKDNHTAISKPDGDSTSV